MAHIGHPVVGDATYGRKMEIGNAKSKIAVARLMLHAYKLGFTHPRTQQVCRVYRAGAGGYGEIVSDLNNIIDETIKALEDMKRSGVTHVDVARETLEELGKPAVVPSVPVGKVGRVAETAAAAPSGVATELAAIEARAKVCVKCGELSRCRHSVVFGVGNPRAEIMFVGEAPGRDEDMQGEPFVGRAGELLTKIIVAMGFKREDVYIANVMKCRPPENRTPLPDEIDELPAVFVVPDRTHQAEAHRGPRRDGGPCIA